MKILITKIILVFLLVIGFHNLSFAEVYSWRYSQQPSLKISDKIGIIDVNYAMMADKKSSINMMRIEEISIPLDFKCSEIFVEFTKKFYTSYLKVKIFDAFTEQELASFHFDESGNLPIEDKFDISRIYLTVDIVGDDIEFRLVGVQLASKFILNEEDFIILPEVLYNRYNNLEVSLLLHEEANVFLFIYNSKGDICSKVVDNETFGSGTYEFYWDPMSLQDYQEGGETFYVWVCAENLRSKRVEYVKEFYVIP